jgi:hypothetical protein
MILERRDSHQILQRSSIIITTPKEHSMDSNRYYIIGPVEKMKQKFPDYAGKDERYSLDGSNVIYEVKITENEKASLEDEGFQALTHAEILEIINAPEAEGMWRPKEPITTHQSPDFPSPE